MLAAGAVRRRRGRSPTGRRTSSPASCSARCTRCAQSVEDKLNRLPLSYVDGHSRGDLLSRVTNDIDNLAQSLQQTVSQILTSLLTLVGVTVMMFTISPLLAVVALITVPLSLWMMKVVSKRARPRFISQWRYTGSVNGQTEEVFTGHAIVKSFGRQRDVEARFAADNDELTRPASTPSSRPA